MLSSSANMYVSPLSTLSGLKTMKDLIEILVVHLASFRRFTSLTVVNCFLSFK